jgi:hypothetical protein
VGIDSHKEPWLGALSISSAERLPQALTGDVDADCFQLGELLEGVAAAEPSAPRFTPRPPPEGQMQLPVVARVVDDNGSGLEPFREPEGSLERACEDCRNETVRAAVCCFEHGVVVSEPDDRCDGPEGLLAVYGSINGDLVQNRRLVEEIGLVSGRSSSSDEDLRTALEGVGHMSVHGLGHGFHMNGADADPVLK